MPKLVICWSHEARENLEEIFQFIAQDSSRRPKVFVDEIKRRAGRLSLFPESGRKVSELADFEPQPREIIIGEYRVIYRVLSKRLEIVTVIHGKRLFPLI